MNITGAKALVPMTFCFVVILMDGCDSEKRATQRRSRLEAERAAVKQQLAEVNAKISDLQKRKKGIQDELERRDQLWRQQVSARHPNWSAEKRKRQLAILSDKWWNSNRSNDADTVAGMKQFGIRLWVDLDLTEADYWDITRALRFEIDRFDLERAISAELKPLEQLRESLLTRQKGISEVVR